MVPCDDRSHPRMPMPPDVVLAIDLGGTKMRAALVSSDGSVSRRMSLTTPQDERDLDQLLELAARVRTSDVSRAVVAVPGRVDYRAGRLEYAPHLSEHWIELLRADHLKDKLGLDVALANDADAAAVGESYFGAGRDYDDVAYLTVSTGVGAGVVLGGELVAGGRSSAETGHTVIDRTALLAGAPATLEDLASGTALEVSAAAVGLPANGREIVELVASGEARAQRIWRELVDAVAIGIVNLAHLFTPQVVVVGGGVGRNGDRLLVPVRRRLARLGPQSLAEPIHVVTSALGDNAGLVGAAAWCRATGGDCRRPHARHSTTGAGRQKSRTRAIA